MNVTTLVVMCLAMVGACAGNRRVGDCSNAGAENQNRAAHSGLRIIGHVRGTDGTSVKDALVTVDFFHREGDMVNPTVIGPIATTNSGTDGHFEVLLPRPGYERLVVVIRHRDYCTLEHVIEAHGLHAIDVTPLRMVPGGVVRGRVGGTGGPVYLIMLRDGSTGAVRQLRVARGARFEMRSIEAGRYVILAAEGSSWDAVGTRLAFDLTAAKRSADIILGTGGTCDATSLVDWNDLPYL